MAELALFLAAASWAALLEIATLSLCLVLMQTSRATARVRRTLQATKRITKASALTGRTQRVSPWLLRVARA
ncbi:MAG TPA: hypothetical protein VEJ63_19360 [Planctomycetota bacterium]|nr:hypothetical protein [Planctomycetota bacterium]